MNVLIFLLCSVVILFILAVYLIIHSYKKDAEEERKQCEKKLKEKEEKEKLEKEKLEKERLERVNKYFDLQKLYGTPTHKFLVNSNNYDWLIIFGEASIIYADDRVIPFKDIISYNIEEDVYSFFLNINIRDLVRPLIRLSFICKKSEINAILAYIVDQNNKK
jgi:hypothetical protein